MAGNGRAGRVAPLLLALACLLSRTATAGDIDRKERAFLDRFWAGERAYAASRGRTVLAKELATEVAKRRKLAEEARANLANESPAEQVETVIWADRQDELATNAEQTLAGMAQEDIAAAARTKKLEAAVAKDRVKAESESRRRRKHHRDTAVRESSGVRCCDGSLSPTCVTVHRGCCSHHGGVCGGG